MDQVGGKDASCGGLSNAPLPLLATEPKAEWPWSPKQSFTAGGQLDGNVCRAELDEVEVAQARRAGAAGTTRSCGT